jgi:hypothetical protein
MVLIFSCPIPLQLPFFRSYMAQRMFRKWRIAARQSAFEKVTWIRGQGGGTAEM